MNLTDNRKTGPLYDPIPVQTLENLLKKRYNVYSQNGENGLLKELLSRLPSNNWVVEFGAWDGKKYSNTYNLIETTTDYRGVYIECDDEKYTELLKTSGEHRQRVIAIHRKVDEYENKLDNILDSILDFPGDPDVISIDVTSNDYQLWKSIEKYRAKIIVIAINSGYSPGNPKIHDGTEPTGTAFTPMVELGKQKGYSLLVHVGNLIFIDNKYSYLFPEINYDVNSVYIHSHNYLYF